MKVHIISIVLIAFMASTLVLAPVEAKPPKSGVVEIIPPAKVNLSEIHIATTGPNIDIFPNSQPQNEPTIAINLENNNILAAGANDYSSGDSWAGTYYSINGGAIWSAGLIPKIGSLAAYSTAGDPWISFNGANIAYYSGIAFNRQTAPNAVFLATSNNGGATFNNPTIVESTTDPNIFHDKPWNAADGNNVYVVWTKFQPGMSPIVFKASSNQGATFGSEVAVSDPGNNQDQGSQVAVGPGGVIYVAWEDFNINRFLLDKSANGGGSFGIDTQVTSIVPIPSPLPNKAFRTNSFPYMAVNKNNGNIYIVWNDYRNGDSDILFTQSTDSGATWSAPIRVNDDPLHNDKDQFFPAISVDQSNGKINIVFYDTRNDPNNHMIDLYYAESTNGGLSFEPNQRVTTVASDPNLDGFGGQFIGDYIGLASGTGNHHPVWADTRTGNADIFTDSLISLVPHLASIVVSPSTASLTVGETQNFNATALDQYNNPMTGISISWTISNSTVGSVTPLSAVTDTTGNASTIFTASVSGNMMVNATNGSITGNTSVAVSSVPSQNLTIFARGGDNALWYREFNSTSRSDWQNLGGSITNLNVISLSGGNIYTFVGGTDGGLWYKNYSTSASWRDWQSLGGSITDIDSIATNNVYTFARGTDGGLWYRNWDGTSWNSWQSLGGYIFNITSAASGANNLDVFARGADGGLWYRNWDGTSWNSWQSLGGSITDIDATSSGNNIYAFVRGTDGSLWYRNWNGTSWSDWQSLGGSITNFGVVSSGNNVYTFARGTDGSLWYRNWDGTSWNSWQSLGGSITNLDAVSSGSTVYVFAQGADGCLWYRSWNGTSWSDWQSLGGYITDLDATS